MALLVRLGAMFGGRLGHGGQSASAGIGRNVQEPLQIVEWARLGSNQRPLACEAIWRRRADRSETQGPRRIGCAYPMSRNARRSTPIAAQESELCHFTR